MPSNKYLHHKHRKNNKDVKILVDKICMGAAVFMPLTTLPQIYKLYSTQDAQSLSLSMWVLYCIGVIPFLLYGILHKELQLIILNILWISVQTIMIIGIVIYN